MLKSDKLKFAAKLQLGQPSTISQSRFVNARVTLNHETMIEDLLARLDEAMTVTGEAYCKNEAFTTLIDLDIKPGAWAARTGSVDAKVDTQVEHTLNVGSKKNVGIMVISSKANNLTTDSPIASTRATFNAIDPDSVHTEMDQTRLFTLLEKLVRKQNASSQPQARMFPLFDKLAQKLSPHSQPQTPDELDSELKALRLPDSLRPVPVQELAIAADEQELNRQSADWNKNLSAFYKQVSTRLGARDSAAAAPDLAQATSSATRLINGNIYVRPEMLNKKRTGHGGIAAANAVRDMLALTKNSALQPEAIVADRVTANYLAPFTVNDALQFDTTIDHVDANNDIFLSSRIYKFDTKRQLIEGPVILVNAKLKGSALKVQPQESQTPDASIREQEALTWAKLISQT